jgi:hypothetical protein
MERELELWLTLTAVGRGGWWWGWVPVTTLLGTSRFCLVAELGLVSNFQLERIPLETKPTRDSTTNDDNLTSAVFRLVSSVDTLNR